MMILIETVSLFLIVFLCVLCSRSDLSSGLIYNRILGVFLLAAVLLDIIYYGFLARELFAEFFVNCLVTSAVGLYLFFSHSFAGGDCKMTIVLAMLFPARYYIAFGNSNYTLVFTLAIAIFAGYCYLLFSSLWAIAKKKVDFTWNYVRDYLIAFIKSYAAAMVYISFFNCVLVLLDRYGIQMNIWVTRVFCMVVAWGVGRFSLCKKAIALIPTFVAVIIISLMTRYVPVSLDIENYALVLVLLFCQMTIKTIIYENIAVADLKKGMILTTFSSMLMQSSITKGLPGISTEDLKSRLTETEVESIRIWAKATRTESLTIVKKIPFAIFISIGFLSYFLFGYVL